MLAESNQRNHLKTIVVIPCYNEARYISEIVSKVKKYVDLVIVTDDGSDDNTADIAKAAGAIVIVHAENKGAGAATKTCLMAAKAYCADIVITLDGDSQHRTEEIPILIEAMQSSKADLVIGSRFLGTNGNMPKYRKFGIKTITWMLNIGSKVKVSDAQCCFRAHSAALVDALDITEQGFGFSIQVIIQAKEKNLRFYEVPISCLYHPDGSTMNPLKHGLGIIYTIIKLRFISKYK